MNNLLEQGFYSIKSENTLEALTKNVLPILPVGYVFLDYKYELLGPSLYTYHRDVTSSHSCFNTKYPTYTAIHYNYNGNLLSVSPGSHRSYKINMPVTIQGESNTTIIIDCDLVHGGIDAPTSIKRCATQYKVIHKDDIHLLKEIDGLHMSKTGQKISPYLQLFLRIGSYIFTVPIQYVCLPLIQRRASNRIGLFLQNLIPINYYNPQKLT